MDALVGKVVKTISDAVKPEKIFLFGSRSNGKAGADSDIDLLLLCTGAEDKRQTQLKVHHLFRDPDFSLDVFILTPDEFERQKGVANTLAREVCETGVLCYG